ncbi:MAG: hypothetical protein ACM3TT_03745 [Syntrophothermus sp.]
MAKERPKVIELYDVLTDEMRKAARDLEEARQSMSFAETYEQWEAGYFQFKKAQSRISEIRNQARAEYDRLKKLNEPIRINAAGLWSFGPAEEPGKFENRREPLILEFAPNGSHVPERLRREVAARNLLAALSFRRRHVETPEAS